MIYLIGGPPKCGKTTLAKKLSKLKKIPWVSTDTLQCAIMPYIDKKNFPKKFPTSKQRCKDNDEKYAKYSTTDIIKAYRKQTKTISRAIDMFVTSEITEKYNHIIEGYHIEPNLVAKLKIKHPGKIKSIFLVKTNEKEFTKNIGKSSTKNDWIISRTKNKNTYSKIANMICKYGSFFIKEAKKYKLKIINTDSNFNKRLTEAIRYFK